MPPFERRTISAGVAAVAGGELYHGPLFRRGWAPGWSRRTLVRTPGFWCSVLFCGLTVVVTAQSATPELPSFRSGVDVVEVFATVVDSGGAPVRGLTADDFVVREDGMLQRVVVFAEGTVPLTVVLAVDRSWSMAGEPLRQAKRAAGGFLRSLRETDRSMVISTGPDTEVVAPITAPRDEQIRAVEGLTAWGTTALYDALLGGLEDLARQPGRLALILFSDGRERYSRADAAEVLASARRATALVYPVEIGTPAPSSVLLEVAALTGGRLVRVRHSAELPAALEGLAGELRHQYLLGYVPAMGNGDRRWRTIDVALRSGQGRVRARSGYEPR